MNCAAWLELVAPTAKVTLVPADTLVTLVGGATMTGGVRNCLAWENSDVLLAGSVAVAVMNWVKAALAAKATEKTLLPLPSVVTVAGPRGGWLFPSPEGGAGAGRREYRRK